MHKGRLEAFSDAVIAIALTIMVLELHPPTGSSLAGLREVVPSLSVYVVSFAYLAIYWNNHHHMMQSAQRVTGGVLWANMHLLFWLSLIPFATAWLGRQPQTSGPAATYGVVLLAAAVAYFILAKTLVRSHGPDSAIAASLGRDFKGKVSIAGYLAGIAVSFSLPLVAVAIYAALALLWLVPDRRFEPKG